MLIDLVGGGAPDAEIPYDYVERRGELIFAEAYLPRLYGGRGAYAWGQAGPLRDQHGAVYGAIESVRDISDRKRAELALGESERQYRLPADNVLEIVTILNLDGRFIYASPSFGRTLGWAPG